jgi:murein DD-endopeptidase MepM/ murein hydrolase activator NlpD
MAPGRSPRWLASVVLALSGTAVAPPPAQAEPGWRYPVDGVPHVLRGFDMPAFPWLPGHRGVDLALGAFEPVLAAAAGTVTFAAPIAGQGVVVVSHGALRSTYQPVEAAVEPGDHVGAGHVLGWLEPATAHCGRTCLHWGVLRGETYLDPMSFVQRAPPVLLPLGAPVPRAIGPAPFASSGVRSGGGEVSGTSASAPTRVAWVDVITPRCLECLGPGR